MNSRRFHSSAVIPARVRAFTLIEVLLVVAIVTLLVAILLPSMIQARGQARRAVCLSNLHQVHLATLGYVNTWRERLPDKQTLGLFGFRRAPGETDPTDVRSLREIWGLAATLDRNRLMPGRGEAWVCPAAAAAMQGHKNTYAFSIAETLSNRPYNSLISASGKKARANFQTWWVWDNYTMKPGDSGWIGPFGSRLNIPVAQRFYPHDYYGTQKWKSGGRERACNVVYLDGHAAQIAKQD